MDWDVFISHASEDKESFVRPLAEALRTRGLRVWYDEFTLNVGDSLRRSIDNGLANSKYGIVILSPSFFKKDWPQRELDGLVAREVPGKKIILPVWYNITADQVRQYSPMLADKKAAQARYGINCVVGELLRAIQGQDSFPPTLVESPQPVASPDIPFPPAKSRESSTLVIGHRLDADVQCVLWDEDEPNIADYDIVIVDFTVDRKPLLPLYRPRQRHDPQFDISSYLNWTHTRSRIESLALSGGTIVFIMNSSFIKHVDSQASYGEEYSRLLPFTLYGECTPIGTSISFPVDPRFDFYFRNLESWNFVFGGQVQFDFEHTLDYKTRVHAIAKNRAGEMLGISIEVNSHTSDKPGWIHALPPLSTTNSFEATKLLVANLSSFA